MFLFNDDLEIRGMVRRPARSRFLGFNILFLAIIVRGSGMMVRFLQVSGLMVLYLQVH